ncbi:hypothetical protein BDA96_01G527900 [Sorghum bicolor]|jgi:hypothetical protein|uniref:Uncharacterized protein n=2 Tax=Sorghum bicolor TaxID=4558 RepID=A0A921S5V7_SORBI|nr:hypothetical protein BDA96_01G527900 [Sorghum bicolor]OQU93181.1 hypothetical protein SORBI_3001G495132 [Sorghum bicolor]
MMMTTAAMRAVLVAVVLMQCCNAIVAARPLLMEAPAVATAYGGGWLEMIMQMLPGGNNTGCQAPNGGCP